IHDAFVAEAEAGQEEEASLALDRVMRDASRVVLRGYELDTDVQIVRAGEHFFDERGLEMWTTVNRLMTGLERGSACAAIRSETAIRSATAIRSTIRCGRKRR